MTTSSTDIAIVGAGCAGLSLATRLVNAGLEDRRIVILDPRTSFPRDRTWCFWNVVSHDFEAAVSNRWASWLVRLEGRETVCHSDTWTYQHIAADDFYRIALERLEWAPNVELRLGVEVEAVLERGERAVVRTHEGELEAALAFDSRPAPVLEGSSGREITLLQHFGGYHVRTARPVFDPSTVTLMDFDVDQRPGIHFVYVLPFSPTAALVEDTWCTRQVLPAETYDANIREWLERRCGVSSFEIGYVERGVIPMTTAPLPARESRRVYRIGLRGGMARPSTGYTFLAIQRYAAAMAERLSREALPEPPPVRSGMTSRLDQVFLARLYHEPEAAPRLFRDLFARVPAEALIRFLSDLGTPEDYWKVMTAVPPMQMARAAMRSWRLWTR